MVVWTERRWPVLGTQELPEKLIVESAQNLAVWIGEGERWKRARQRYEQIVANWPALASRLPRYFDALADYSSQDMCRLEALLAWLDGNPRSQLYPRQIPLPGMDTKWLEPRMQLVSDLIGVMRIIEGDGAGFHERCGLREAPHVVRFRLLDPRFREHFGGLSDIAAPIAEVAALDLPVSRAYIVENLQTGLCFPDMPGSIVFMGLGYGVSGLGRVSWLTRAECIYWGDLDTHGFAILSRSRMGLPGIVSALMDEATLLQNKELWVEERDQYDASTLPLLTDEEQSVYQGLKRQRWGRNVRLEQERIAWNDAWRFPESWGKPSK
jgi:hypothetical protein